METATLIKSTLKAGDTVQVIAGKEKGKTGRVVSVHGKTGRVTVEGVNKVKRHMKPSAAKPEGGIVERELPVHLSNVQVFCPSCSRGVRTGMRFVEKKSPNGASSKVKVRVCKRCDESLDSKSSIGSNDVA